MNIKINEDLKTITIRDYGSHTFKEIKREIKKALGNDRLEYKLYWDSLRFKPTISSTTNTTNI